MGYLRLHIEWYIIIHVLFTMYITPLGDIAREHQLLFHMFADDKQLYLSFSPGDKVQTQNSIALAQDCVRDIDVWLGRNMLKNNGDKLEAIVFGTWQQRRKLDFDSITLLDNPVAISDKVKNLGIVFDADMSINLQISQMVKCSSFHLRNISMVRRHLPLHAAKAAINASVTSRLDTGNSLLAGICNCTLIAGSVQCTCKIQRLQLVQNNAARVLSYSLTKSDHISPYLQDLHWLPIRYRIIFKILTTVFKCVHGTAPEYLCELVTPYQPCRNMRSSSGLLLNVPKTKLATAGDRMFSCIGPQLWNSLPLNIRQCQTLYSFKRALKTYLFSIAYSL